MSTTEPDQEPADPHQPPLDNPDDERLLDKDDPRRIEGPDETAPDEEGAA